ncbi:MAG: hypothetical protein U0359_05205 [Byssovorax sp.]
MHPRHFWALALVPLLAGCGESSSSSTGTTSGGPMDDVLAPPEIGMQLVTTKTKVEAGAEKYACWGFQVPADADLDLVGFQVQVQGAGVHHYGIFTDSSGMSKGDDYECESMGITWGLVTGGGVGTPGVSFPEGTAMKLPAGRRLIVQLHMLNTSSDAVEIGEQRFNLIGAKPGSYEPVGLLIAGTLDINIPAHQKGVQASGGCTLTDPMEHIFAVFPHMHRLGTNITTTVSTAGGAPKAVSNITWDFKDQGIYEASSSAKVGDDVKVTCTYDNATDKDVKFGLHSGDEMCVDVLYHYPAKEPAKYCGIGD